MRQENQNLSTNNTINTSPLTSEQNLKHSNHLNDRLKSFNVFISEFNYGSVTVQANDCNEAKDLARLMYEEGDVLLSVSGDRSEVSFECVET